MLRVSRLVWVLQKIVKKLIDGASVSVKFHREPLNHFIMSDDKEALITTAKESGLCESPSLWTNNSNLIGVLRTGFESDWKKAEDYPEKLSLSFLL